MGKLTVEQRRFLKFHAMKPAPHAWAWQGDLMRPATWSHLQARRYLKGKSGDQVVCLISREGLAGLDGYWAQPLLELNEAGKQAAADA